MIFWYTWGTHPLPFQNCFQPWGNMDYYQVINSVTTNLKFWDSNYSPSQPIREEFKVSWDSKSIKYLGVNIPKHLNMNTSENYDPLFSKIKLDLTRWNLVLFLGLEQRVEAIKMNVLPRLLYLFQNIPAEHPNEKFQELDKLISRFIWQGKRPRIHYKTLPLAIDKLQQTDIGIVKIFLLSYSSDPGRGNI